MSVSDRKVELDWSITWDRTEYNIYIYYISQHYILNDIIYFVLINNFKYFCERAEKFYLFIDIE